MAVIINNCETEEEIERYKKWLSSKSVGQIQRLKRMLEVDKKYRPDRWKNVDVKIKLMEEAIKRKLH